MEPKLGADLSGVRVHTGSDSAAAASSFGARAFTVGADVHFNSGQFSPGTKEGDRLIAHELTHVVQAQKSGVQRKAEEGAEAEAKGDDGKHEVSSPEEPAEKEADKIGDQVAEEHDGDATAKDSGAEAKGDAKTDGKRKPSDKRGDQAEKKAGNGDGKKDEAGQEGKPEASDKKDDAKQGAEKTDAASGANEKKASEADGKKTESPTEKPTPKVQAKLEGSAPRIFLAPTPGASPRPAAPAAGAAAPGAAGGAGAAGAAPEKPLPTSLVQPNATTIAQPSESVELELLQGGPVQASGGGGDVRQTVENIVRKPGARQEATTLTLPPLDTAALQAAPGATALAQSIVAQTGVSSVTIQTSGDTATVTEQVNPQAPGPTIQLRRRLTARQHFVGNNAWFTQAQLGAAIQAPSKAGEYARLWVASGVLTEATHQNSAGEKMYSFTPDVMHHENPTTLATAVETRWGRMKPALQTQIQGSSTENFAFQAMTVDDAAKSDGIAWVRTTPPEANIPKPPLNNELVQRLVNGEDSALKTGFQSRAGTKVADQVKTFGQQKQLAPELMTKVGYEPNLGPYGTVKMPDSADVDAEVLAAVASAGDILGFFRLMASGGTPKLTRCCESSWLMAT